MATSTVRTFLSYIVAVTSLMVSLTGSAAQPIALDVPGCSCSAGSKAQYQSGSTASEVYIANCYCPPQMCAVTWNTKSDNAGVQLACTNAIPAKQWSNCVDFTRLPEQNQIANLDLGSFSVRNAGKGSLFIQPTQIVDASGKVVDGPNALRGGGRITITLPSETTLLTFKYIPGMGAGWSVDWLNGKGEAKQITLPAKQQFKVQTEDINEPAGFTEISVNFTEYAFLKICAFK